MAAPAEATRSPEAGGDGSRLDLDGSENNITMAIELKMSGSLGCAYYSYYDGALYLLEDTRLADLDTVEQLVIHAQPTTLLLPMRSPEPLHDYVKRLDRQGGDASEGGFLTSWLPVAPGSIASDELNAI
jgi:hypothetical protein